MAAGRVRIGVVAPGSAAEPALEADIGALVRQLYPAGEVEVWFHPQCFVRDGHFAGDDATRARAVLDVANDPAFDAVWVARGGYGACRIAEAVVAGLAPCAADKAWLGYSDAGALLAALYRQGFTRLAHGPVAQDLRRTGGEAAVARALAWLARADPASLEPSLADDPRPAAAFNITILSGLLGTPLEPDLSGHVLMLEEVSEYMYRIDRALFQITSNPAIRRVAGLRLGRCSLIPENDPDFGRTEEEVARYWCERSGIPWLGRADIGHDAENRVAPFGTRQGARPGPAARGGAG